MILSDISIKRPVFATVISLLIVVFGISALMKLSVREYPDIDPPEVSISVDYAGAAPEVIDTQIIQVIEGAVAGVEGVRKIESRSRLGSARTSVEFNLDRDVDVAANDLRDAVSRVLNRLPEEAETPVIAKADADAENEARRDQAADHQVEDDGVAPEAPPKSHAGHEGEPHCDHGHRDGQIDRPRE